MTFILQHENIAIMSEPTSEYLRWASETNAYFDSTEWGEILHLGFGANRYYLWDYEHTVGVALTIFKKGPFSIGYLGFPVCVVERGNSQEKYALDRMLEAISIMPKKPNIIRSALSPFSTGIINRKNNAIATTESCISNLRDWSLEDSEKRRRASRRAKRGCIDLILTNKASGAEMYYLYKLAIIRNLGSSRYTYAYFESLSKQILSGTINFFGFKKEKKLVSMIITAKHGDTVYYLHGGSAQEALSLGASDFLIQKAIESAKSSGATSFNFLSSPENQTGLIRFKEKWGGESLTSETAQIIISPTGLLLNELIKTSQLLRSLQIKAISA